MAFRQVAAALAMAGAVVSGGAAQAQSRTPSQEQDAIAEGLLSQAERYCLAPTAEQGFATARAEGYVTPPAALSAMLAQPGATDVRMVWKIADTELWLVMAGTMQRPEGAAEFCAVTAHPSVDDMAARTEARLGVGPAQSLGAAATGFVFEQRPDGSRKPMAAADAMKQLGTGKGRSLRLVAVQDAPIVPGARMTAVMAIRPR